MKRLTVAATLLLSLAGLAGPSVGGAMAACAAPAKATAYDDPSHLNDGSAQANNLQWDAQSFKVPANITLTKVALYVSKHGSPGDSITVEIRSDAAGKPGALLGTRTRTLTNTAFEFAEFDFTSDHLSFAAGTTYHLDATNTATNNDGYSWAVNPSNTTYAGGAAARSFDHGQTWSDEAGWVFLFQVFGQTCTADNPGGGGNQSPTQAVASTLAFSDKAFAAENSGPSATNARKKKPPRGTKVSFKLNEAASVRFTVTQRAKGRKVKRGKKRVCVKPTRKNRKKKSCIRVVTLKGSFSRSGVAGRNSFHFSGRLNGRKLKPGRYRLVATPSAGGKKGKRTSKRFRIVR